MDFLDDVFSHAEEMFPNECCGVVVVIKGKERYVRCRNVAERMFNEFVIHPEDYVNALESGEIIKIVHSHPRSNANPSEADKAGIEESKLPWVIVNPKTKQVTETYPSGYKAPLIGRQYSYGALDCFTIVRDYYKEVLNIDLPDIFRDGYWWNQGRSMILENYERYGFVKVPDLKKHDLILMATLSSLPNHFGIYLGDGNMLHHAQGRLSSRDVYGNSGYWHKHTWGYIRHVDLL